jgi:hypothetical protein
MANARFSAAATSLSSGAKAELSPESRRTGEYPDDRNASDTKMSAQAANDEADRFVCE